MCQNKYLDGIPSLFGHSWARQSLGETVGHSTTVIFPSGARSRVGAYRPKYCRRHQFPVARFSAIDVNQYCQSTARICWGASCENGLPANSDRTSLSFMSSLISVFGTIGDSRQELSDANHRFQSKRG